MLELRWLEREVVMRVEGPFRHVTTERFLQFRTKIMTGGPEHIEVGDGTFLRNDKPWGEGWSEWADVPVVKE